MIRLAVAILGAMTLSVLGTFGAHAQEEILPPEITLPDIILPEVVTGQDLTVPPGFILICLPSHPSNDVNAPCTQETADDTNPPDNEITDYQVVPGRIHTVAPGGLALMATTCPDEKEAVGGGIEILSPDNLARDDVQIIVNEPSEDSSAWVGGIVNNSDQNVDFTVTAICADVQ